jgi:hypothetical protein
MFFYAKEFPLAYPSERKFEMGTLAVEETGDKAQIDPSLHRKLRPCSYYCSSWPYENPMLQFLWRSRLVGNKPVDANYYYYY